MNFKIKVSKSVSPESSFVESITLENDMVTVKMKNRKTLYHYNLDENAKNAIASIKNGVSAGRAYNRFLRGKSVAKTLFH